MTESRTLFHSVSTQNLSEHVRSEIVDAIREGKLGAGERLPSERELAEQFSVSRVVVREGLRSLEARGVIEVRPGRGAFVSLSPNDALSRSWRTWLVAHRSEVLELLAVREAIEQLAARRAAERATSADVEALLENCEELEAEAARAFPRIERLVELDVAFHHLIAEIGGGSLLPKLIDELAVVLTESRRATFSLEGRGKVSTIEHRGIVSAVAAHDPVAAATALVEHMRSVISTAASVEFDAVSATNSGSS